MSAPRIDGTGAEPRRYGRAVFLATLAGGASSLAWGEPLWRRVSGAISPVAAAVAPILPTQGWRIYAVSGNLPDFDPKSWRLELGGLVERPTRLDYAGLRALPRAEQVSTFHCVTGWTVRDVHWAGVRIRDLLAHAKPLPRAHALRFVSTEEPYVDYLTLKQASLADVMVAYEQDGKPLAREHGAPLRLVIPEMYGYKGVKWLRSIELVPRAEAGYWEQLGYDRDAWVGRSNGYGA